MKTKIAEEITMLVCDDIRAEVGGKSSFMGVYSTDIVVPKLPSILNRLAFGVLILRSKIEVVKMDAVLIHPKGKLHLITPTFKGSVPKGSDLNINLFIAPFKIEEPGKRELEITFNEDNKLKVTRAFEVRVDPTLQLQ